jgi:flagellar basal-body rod protein FlgG
MLQALWSASSGMLAQQMSLDGVSNNIANVNTSGYKKSRVEFQDLLYSETRSSGQVTRMGDTIPNGFQVGSGTRPAANFLLVEQGSIINTGNKTDFAISGDGFFEILLPDGKKAYTRDGSFKIDSDGYLVTAGGYTVNMKANDGGLLTFIQDGTQISIDEKGMIKQDTSVLKLEAFTFNSPKDLKSITSGVFRPTTNSGEAVLLSETETEDIEELTDEEGNPLPAPKKVEQQVYYQIVYTDGEVAYTNENSFKLDETGRLITANKGYVLDPEVTFDLEAEDNPVKAGDVVKAGSEGNILISSEIGSLNIAKFSNPAGLEKQGSNLFIPTVNSGNAQAADDFKLVSGALEGSNVQIADEMVTMMMAQRAYELGSRAIRTADEMLGMANALLRR